MQFPETLSKVWPETAIKSRYKISQIAGTLGSVRIGRFASSLTSRTDWVTTPSSQSAMCLRWQMNIDLLAALWTVCVSCLWLYILLAVLTGQVPRPVERYNCVCVMLQHVLLVRFPRLSYLFDCNNTHQIPPVKLLWIICTHVKLDAYKCLNEIFPVNIWFFVIHGLFLTVFISCAVHFVQLCTFIFKFNLKKFWCFFFYMPGRIKFRQM
jgi:hypothetical protein